MHRAVLSVTVVTYSLVDTRRNLTDIRMEYGSLSHQHANVKGFFFKSIWHFFNNYSHPGIVFTVNIIVLIFLNSLIKLLYRLFNNLDLNEYICDIQMKKIYISI